MKRHLVRRVVAGATFVLAAGMIPVLASPAHADTNSSLTVVGTSDVSDSGLMQNVIIPGFEAAYPNITMTYVGSGTGQAIATAQSGTASALVVHAASLENQFVADGYSLEPYGRATFWGDYVLLGPQSDPAGIGSNGDSQDIVKAFQDIAAAGAAGKAEFVSRGGNPGTTIQEHAIWGLTSGVPSCTVSDTDGGGKSPSGTPGDCPTIASGTPIDYPSWYHATGAKQAANILAADSCNFGAADNDCYVFTDRGTYQSLENAGSLTNMKLLVDNNDSAPASQKFLLVNSFHMYAINPDAVPSGSSINTTGATKLLNWVTSPTGQAAIAAYLATSGKSGPFRPDAAPTISASALPASVKAGTQVSVAGSVANVVPGTPKLNGVKVSLLKTVGSTTSVVTTGTTGKSGKYTITFSPKSTATYSLSTPPLTKIERPDLSPIFADQLQSATRALSKVTVKGAPTLTKATPSGKKLKVTGKLSPKVSGSKAKLQLWAARVGKDFKQVGSSKLASGATSYSKSFTLSGTGAWRVQVRYVNPGIIATGSSNVVKVTTG